MAATVYILCTLSCLACAVLLFRGYRSSRLELLFWSANCFFILAVANLLLIVDLVILPGPLVDLSIWRSVVTLIAIIVILYGLIFQIPKKLMLNAFLSGAIAMGCLVVVGYFFRFWQQTRDRLFLFFAAAFAIFILERILRFAFNLENEFAPFVYSTRLVAYSLIIAAIVDKNRRRERP